MDYKKEKDRHMVEYRDYRGRVKYTDAERFIDEEDFEKDGRFDDLSREEKLEYLEEKIPDLPKS